MAKKPSYAELEQRVEELENELVERKRVEEALQDSENRLQAILNNTLNNTTALIFIKDLRDRYILTNRAFERTLNFSKEEFLGKTDYDFMPKEMADKYRENNQKVLKSGKPLEFEETALEEDGIHTAISIKVPMFDADGNPYGICSISTDITERKQAEEALRRENDFTESLIDTAQAIILLLDIKGRIVRFNTYMEDLSGYKLKEVQGRDWFRTFLPEQDCDRIREVFRAAVSNIQTRGNINPIVAKDGREIFVEWYDKTLKDADGNTIGLLAIGQDITERKQAEEFLQESEEKYRSMMEAMNDAACISSPHFRIEYMNPAMIDRIGRDVTGEVCYEAIYDSKEKCPWCAFDRVQEKEHVSYELTDPKSNRYYSVTNSPIPHADGTVSKLTIFRDITEIRAMEEHLRHAQKMEAIGTLAGGIAHEFNNILGILIGNTELAFNDVPEWSPAKDCLKEIRTASFRAKDVVRQIMSFARKTTAEREPINISTIIKESLKLLRATLPTSIDIRQEILCESEMILGNPTEINQILINLCKNSAHAIKDETGVLEVRLETVTLNDNETSGFKDLKAGDYVKLTVKDTGCGIDPEIMDRIMDPYFTTKDVDKGLGMGLAVVSGLVKKHDGAIKFASEAGKGTIAEVLFPVTEEKAKTGAKKYERLGTGTERILVVDDEASLVKLVSKILELQGYQVVGKTSSTEALKQFQANPDQFDLVITDMAMPNITGDRLAQELIKIRPDIPIVLCTGHSDRIDKDKAKVLGISEYVMKPFDMKKLTKMVREVLDKTRS